MKLKEKIEAKGLKQLWVAKQIGISANLLNLYLNGSRPMPAHIEYRIKALLA